MAVATAHYGGGLAADTNLHPSQVIWGDCPVDAINQDPGLGIHLFEDFRNIGKTTAVSANVGRYNGDQSGAYITWEDTSCTLTQLIQSTVAQNGVARFSITASANKAVVLEFGYGTAYSSGSTGGFIYTDGTGGKLWFECRLTVNSIAANTNNLFVGLAQSGVAVQPAAATSTTTLFDSASGVGNTDLLGFDILSSAPSAIRCVYGKNASARTSAGAAQTAVASTYYKLGFLADPATLQTNVGTAPTRKKVRWFVNGLEQQNLSDTLTSPFPTGAVMTPAIHFQGGSAGSAITMDIDWIRAAQVYTT